MARADHIGIEHGPEQHGVLAAQAQRTPGSVQADERLAAETASALVERAAIRAYAHLQREGCAQAAAQILAAAKAQARRNAAREIGHTRQGGAARAHMIHGLDGRVHDAVDLH